MLKHTNGVWCLCDTSTSMNKLVAGTIMSRLQAMQDAIDYLTPHVKIITYASEVHIVERGQDFTLGGWTHLLPALVLVEEQTPTQILVIGDGLVGGHDKSNGEEAAQCLEYARTMEASIDTLYIGGDDIAAERFMRQLATVGRGKYNRYDTTRVQNITLMSTVKALLDGPR